MSSLLRKQERCTLPAIKPLSESRALPKGFAAVRGRPIFRGNHGRGHAFQYCHASCRDFRREGLSAVGGHPADGQGPPYGSRGPRNAYGSRTGRSGHEFPEQLPPTRGEKDSPLCPPISESCRGTPAHRRAKLSYNSTRDEKTIEAEPSVRLDYIEICDPRTLQEIDQIDQDAVFALAAYVGKVRLIDNFVYRTTVEL